MLGNEITYILPYELRAWQVRHENNKARNAYAHLSIPPLFEHFSAVQCLLR